MSLITGAITQIIARVKCLEVSEPIRIRPADCSDPSFKWPAWGKDSGIYSFENNRKVLYIGRAFGASLKQRLKYHCASRDNLAWVEVLESAETQIYVFILPQEDWYWAASIEAKLNADISTVFGKRMS